MEYITTQEAAELWGVKIRRVQALCESNRIKGAKRLGQIWVIPQSTLKPPDGRTKAAHNLEIITDHKCSKDERGGVNG
jgi:excisionase family DNA binding protein